MSRDIVVPEVGEAGMEVTFVRWHKSEGEAVDEGEALFEVDTAKAQMDVEAFAAGVLTDQRVSAGDEVEPQQVVATLLSHEETAEPADAGTPAPTGPGATGAAAGAAASGGAPTTETPGTAGISGSAEAPAAPTGSGAGRTTTGEMGAGTEGDHTPGDGDSPGAAGSAARVSPRARRRARELGVDPTRLTPSDGRAVSVDDVEAAAARGDS